MRHTMRSVATIAFVTMALVAGFWSSADAADDAHQRNRTAPTTSTSTQPSPAQWSEAQPNPMPGNAQDMMGAMKSMPAHDHDTCCGAKKSDSAKDGRNH